MLRLPYDKYCGPCPTYNPTRDTAHDEAPNRPMTPPAKHDRVRRKSVGRGEDSLDGRLLHEHDFDIWPPAGQCTPCAFGCHSAPRSSTERRMDRVRFGPPFRATTARTRVRAGHGKCTAVAIAALAWCDPSVATKTRNSLFLAMLLASSVQTVNLCRKRSSVCSHFAVPRLGLG